MANIDQPPCAVERHLAFWGRRGLQPTVGFLDNHDKRCLLGKPEPWPTRGVLSSHAASGWVGGLRVARVDEVFFAEGSGCRAQDLCGAP